MDVTVAFILKSWALMALIMTLMGLGITVLTIKICDLIDKWTSHRGKDKKEND